MTEKAICIKPVTGGRPVWFPRKALVSGTERDGYKVFRVAKWFTCSREHFMAATSHSVAA